MPRDFHLRLWRRSRDLHRPDHRRRDLARRQAVHARAREWVSLLRDKMMDEISRRQFMGTTLAAGAALAMAGSIAGAAESSKVVRVGMTGMGERGLSLLPTLLALPDVRINAVCDIDDA